MPPPKHDEGAISLPVLSSATRRALLAALAPAPSLALGVGCRGGSGGQAEAEPATHEPSPTAPATEPMAHQARGGDSKVHGGRDPAHPPIDCSLRKRGIDPTKKRPRPFEEVETYIAFLEWPDRAVWQKPDEVVAALHLRGPRRSSTSGPALAISRSGSPGRYP